VAKAKAYPQNPPPPATSGPRRREWFERWFGAEYAGLYPRRDAAQAADQVRALLRAVEASGAAVPVKILDIACGAGRHLRALREDPGVRAFGIDLSTVLLGAARASGQAVARADMRRLPFPDGTFDLAACFFSSFGYFETPAEDLAALGGFVRVVRPGGLLFLDLPNPELLRRDLVSAEVVEAGGGRVEITRHIEGDCVVKCIRILSEPKDGGDGEVYEERLRLHTPASLGPVLGPLKLETVAMLGDENGGAFVPGESPRMGLLLRLPGEAA
jgi:SAM-dependent methyltransferase